MTHKYIFLVLLSTALTTCTHPIDLFANINKEQPEPKIEFSFLDKEQKKGADWKGFLEGYVPALCMASCVGAVSGLICALLERKKILPWQISWFLFWGTRDTTIHLISKDMKTHNIPHNKRLCSMTARLVDWFVYIYFSFTL